MLVPQSPRAEVSASTTTAGHKCAPARRDAQRRRDARSSGPCFECDTLVICPASSRRGVPGEPRPK